MALRSPEGTYSFTELLIKNNLDSSISRFKP
jgi:hypothetical protein